ncbi:MAG: TIGR03790 family protein [Gammaproteobacteria bacterium]|nr:TIGR03790 family protein [Gammaproteobacteria bacterium]
MALASTDFDQAKRLIDRGVASDNTSPEGTAFLVSTSDKHRNVRSVLYPFIYQQFQGLVNIEQINADYLEHKTDILFYFTGIKDVEKLDTLEFLPGAIADHLTSTGGVLDGRSQMSILRWLEAGATGSYGAVTEPCNFPAKFPNPAIAIASYASGETLIEAYWKSVLQPGQGIFVGEPLAKPFGGYQVSSVKDQITVKTRTLKPGVYLLLSAENEDGPFRPEKTLMIQSPANRVLQLPNEKGKYYRITRIGSLPATGSKAVSHQTTQ